MEGGKVFQACVRQTLLKPRECVYQPTASRSWFTAPRSVRQTPQPTTFGSWRSFSVSAVPLQESTPPTPQSAHKVAPSPSAPQSQRTDPGIPQATSSQSASPPAAEEKRESNRSSTSGSPPRRFSNFRSRFDTNDDIARRMNELIPPRTDIYSAIDAVHRKSREASVTNNLYNELIDADIQSRRAELDSIALRLKPTLGRSIEIGGLGDLTRAFRMLERKCMDNNVKRDEISQRTHVRRGQRRKNDRMRRWRMLFREGFIAECDRIRRMRKQGW